MRSALVVRIPFWLVCPLLLLLAQFCAFLSGGQHVSGNTIADSDTLMRLAYLRQVWSDGTWHHGFFDRNNAPYGMVMHWTLPFNLLVLGFARSLFFMPHDQALHYAGYWTGPLLRVGVALAAYWAARRMLSPIVSAFVTGLILFSPFLLNYADLGSANHHPLLYLDTVLMAGLGVVLTSRPERADIAVVAGMVGAFCIWCSFELVILPGGLFAWLFLLWVREGKVRSAQLLLAGASFAAVTDFALLVDPPYGGLSTIVFDHVSMALESLACLPLLVAICVLPRWAGSPVRRFSCLTIPGLVWGGLFLLRYPSVLSGVEGAMDPYVVTEWLNDIGEVKPIHGWRKIVLYLGPACLCLPLALVMVRRWWGKVLAVGLLAALCVMGQLHYRFAGYPIVAGSLFLGYFVQRGVDSRQRPVRLAAACAAGLLFASYYGAEAASSIFDVDLTHPGSADAETVNNDNSTTANTDDAQADNDDSDDDDDSSCEAYDVREALNELQGHGGKPPIIAADTNMAPALLYWSDVRTLAGNYHRDSAGIKDNYLFFRDPGDGTAREIALKRGIDYVLLCNDGDNADYSYSTTETAKAETGLPGHDAKPENTLYTRLADGNPPPWLKKSEWPDDTKTSLLLYEVDRSRLSAN